MKIQLGPTIQSIMFSAPHPVTLEDLEVAVNKNEEELISKDDIIAEIQNIKELFSNPQFGFELQETGLGYSFVSKKEYYPTIVNFIETFQKKRLSKSAMETLSIIAFQQDCTKMDIELIRGVSVDYAIDKLLERDLIEVSGRRDAPGQPITYRITGKFLDYFGIKSIEELPKLKDIEVSAENEMVSSMENDMN